MSGIDPAYPQRRTRDIGVMASARLIGLILLCPAGAVRKADAFPPILVADRQTLRAASILAPVIARHHAAASTNRMADMLLRP